MKYASPRLPCFLRLFLCAAIALLPVCVAAAEADEESELLAAFKQGNHVALMRHALAPGTGDPENFRLGDCSTQRNLSREGRNQAMRIGGRLKQGGITDADIFTSQWCRCQETAELLGLGVPAPLPALNSFFGDYSRKTSQTEALSAWLAGRPLERPLILVTHQVNITAFTGIYPDSGEVVLMRKNGAGGFDIAGSIRTD